MKVVIAICLLTACKGDDKPAKPETNEAHKVLLDKSGKSFAFVAR